MPIAIAVGHTLCLRQMVVDLRQKDREMYDWQVVVYKVPTKRKSVLQVRITIRTCRRHLQLMLLFTNLLYHPFSTAWTLAILAVDSYLVAPPFPLSSHINIMTFIPTQTRTTFPISSFPLCLSLAPVLSLVRLFSLSDRVHATFFLSVAFQTFCYFRLIPSWTCTLTCN